MIRRLIGRQNQHGWPVARIRFAKNLAGSPQELFASLSAKWLRRSSPRSIRVIKQSRTENGWRNPKRRRGVFARIVNRDRKDSAHGVTRPTNKTKRIRTGRAGSPVHAACDR